MYLEISGYQNQEMHLPEGSLPPGLPKGSKVGICTRGNASEELRSPKPEKGAPGTSPSPRPPKSSKVAMCIRGNVSGEFRSPKPEKGAPGDLLPPGPPKTSKVSICTRGNVSGELRSPKPTKRKSRRGPLGALEAHGPLRSLRLELYSASQNKSSRRDTTVHICFAGFQYELRKQFHRCAYISKLEKSVSGQYRIMYTNNSQYT
jgi:hypothetical protein